MLPGVERSIKVVQFVETFLLLEEEENMQQRLAGREIVRIDFVHLGLRLLDFILHERKEFQCLLDRLQEKLFD